MKPTVTMLSTTSAAVDLTSGALDLGDDLTAGISCIFTGSDIVGVLKVQVSRDNSTYFDASNSSVNVSASEDEGFDIETGFRYVRIDWTATSGTGNLTVTGSVKEPGKSV